MRDKVRKRVRAKKIREEGFGKHVSNQELVKFHKELAEETRERKRPKPN